MRMSCITKLLAMLLTVLVPAVQVHAAGALALSNCWYGSSTDEASVEAASKWALFRCGLQKDGDCRLVATVRKGCIALVRDASQREPTCPIKAYTVGPDLPAVINEALKKCQSQGGKQCSVSVAKCDTSG